MINNKCSFSVTEINSQGQPVTYQLHAQQPRMIGAIIREWVKPTARGGMTEARNFIYRNRLPRPDVALRAFDSLPPFIAAEALTADGIFNDEYRALMLSGGASKGMRIEGIDYDPKARGDRIAQILNIAANRSSNNIARLLMHPLGSRTKNMPIEYIDSCIRSKMFRKEVRGRLFEQAKTECDIDFMLFSLPSGPLKLAFLRPFMTAPNMREENIEKVMARLKHR